MNIGGTKRGRNSSDTDILVSGLQRLNLKAKKAKKPKTEAQKLQSEIFGVVDSVMDGQSRSRKRPDRYVPDDSRAAKSKGRVKTKVKGKATKIKESSKNDTRKKVQVKVSEKKIRGTLAASSAKKTSNNSLESLINAMRNLRLGNNKTVKFHSVTKGDNSKKPVDGV